MGVVPYCQTSFSAGTLSFAFVLSSHDEFRPMIGSPPTVSLVYVTLKSVVSYHVNGSRYVPFALAGMVSCDTPLRLEFEGFPTLESAAEVDVLVFESFFDIVTPTGIATTSISTTNPSIMTSQSVSNMDHKA